RSTAARISFPFSSPSCLAETGARRVLFDNAAQLYGFDRAAPSFGPLLEVAHGLADAGQGERLREGAGEPDRWLPAAVGAVAGADGGGLPTVRGGLLDVEAAGRGVGLGQVDRGGQPAAGPGGLLDGRVVDALAGQVAAAGLGGDGEDEPGREGLERLERR